jgi:hypothetical protein
LGLEDDYFAGEDITAAFAMTALNLSPAVTALMGVRFEHTSTDFTQKHPETQSTPLRGSGTYSNVISSVHLTLRPDASSNLFAAGGPDWLVHATWT